ncbi:MAG: DUF4436 family protein [Cyanobacteria bacterium CRU_2_1]|nr:DUF4436 family protein [Cyanobacteria bacterium RU_5_0]NJR58462.1 DUF4436 family protein [Cyanobacteria bacterium CRU_2_1]
MKPLLLGICSFILVVVLHVGLFSSIPIATAQAGVPAVSLKTSASDGHPVSSVPKSAEDVVQVNLTVLSIDPIAGELKANLRFEPRGIYRGDIPVFLSQALVLRTNSVEQEFVEVPFEANEPISIPQVTFSIGQGEIDHYPFDKHTARVLIALTPTPANADVSPTLEPVPLVLNFVANVPGFDIAYQPAFNRTLKSTDENADVFVSIDVVMVRTIAIQVFAVVIMMMMWVLSTLALLVAIRTSRLKQPDFAILGWMSILMFAFPIIRNAQPGVPPVGTISDFFSLFWAEIIVTIALILLITRWLKTASAK